MSLVSEAGSMRSFGLRLAIDCPLVASRSSHARASTTGGCGAVVDADDDAAAAGRSGHARVAGDREDRMRRGHRVHVVALAAGRGLSVKFAPVPGCDSALTVRRRRLEGNVFPAQGGVGTVGAG